MQPLFNSGVKKKKKKYFNRLKKGEKVYST